MINETQIVILVFVLTFSLMGGLIIPHSRSDYNNKTMLGKLIVGLWHFTCIVGLTILFTAHCIGLFWNKYCIRSK